MPGLDHQLVARVIQVRKHGLRDVDPEAPGGGEILADLGKHSRHRRLSIRALLRDPVGAPPELFEKPDAVVTLSTLAVGRSQGTLELTPIAFSDQTLARVIRKDAGQEQREITKPAVDRGTVRLRDHIRQFDQPERIELTEAPAPPAPRGLDHGAAAGDVGIRGEQFGEKQSPERISAKVSQAAGIEDGHPLPWSNPFFDEGGLTEVAYDAMDQHGEDEEWRASQEWISAGHRKQCAERLRTVDQRLEPLGIATHVVTGFPSRA